MQQVSKMQANKTVTIPKGKSNAEGQRDRVLVGGIS